MSGNRPLYPPLRFLHAGLTREHAADYQAILGMYTAPGGITPSQNLNNRLWNLRKAHLVDKKAPIPEKDVILRWLGNDNQPLTATQNTERSPGTITRAPEITSKSVEPPPLTLQSAGELMGLPPPKDRRERPQKAHSSNDSDSSDAAGEVQDIPKIPGIPKGLVEQALSLIVSDEGTPVTWDSIAGLTSVKRQIQEAIVWPMKRPDIFGNGGLRSGGQGMLLFGPPGTGKTLLAKAVAYDTGATFFSVSASSLLSKWMGQGEKMIAAVFAVARAKAPSVVFLDEVDSLLSARSSGEDDAMRRIKNELFLQMDGISRTQAIVSDNKSEKPRNRTVTVLAATNRPDELDDAARRRLPKRLLVPLPDRLSRAALLKASLARERHSLKKRDFMELVQLTEGYSGSDLKNVCTDAAMGPIRDITAKLGSGHTASEPTLSQFLEDDEEDEDEVEEHIHEPSKEKMEGNERLKLEKTIADVVASDIPPIAISHFLRALELVKPSVDRGMLQKYEDWNEEFGSYKRTIDSEK